MSHLVEYAGRRYPLGRLNDAPHDPANRDYPAARATAPRRRVRWIRNGSILNQGRIGSCTGQALAGWLNSASDYRGPVQMEPDAVRFYEWATRADRIRGVYPPTDTGSTGPAVAKGARNHGVIRGWAHAFGLEHLLDALQLGPAMVGTVWLNGMFDTDPKGLVVPSGKVAGGHEYLADEYIPAGEAGAELIGFQNSWGDWGVGGRFYMRSADVASLLAEHGDVTVPHL